MSTNRRLFLVILLLNVTTVSTVNAQDQQIYKSVDKQGHVTYSTSPPEDGGTSEIIYVAPASTIPVAPSPHVGGEAASASQPAAPGPAKPMVREVDYADMGLDELDAECSAAREAAITPMREAEIERCIESRSPQDYCERFYSDFGEARVNPEGGFVPRMFNDLPICVIADQERRRRGKSPPSGR